MTHLVIELTETQSERAEAKARALGFEDSNAYLRAVVEEALDDDEDPSEILAGLERSLQQMQRGELLTVDEMWRDLETGQ
jgi:hypothetical protein